MSTNMPIVNNAMSAIAFSISDLLLIKLGTFKEEDLNKDKYYYIPSYQRKYNWTIDGQINKLINDLNEFWSTSSMDESKSYFLGNVVLKQNDQSNESKISYSVIDGQQRMTTFFILICAVYAELNKKRSDEKLLKELESMIIIDRNSKLLKIHNNNSNIFLTNIKKEAFGDAIEEMDHNNNYYSNYLYLKDNLFKKTEAEEWVKIIKRVKVAMITLGENDDEVAVFESINSTGLPLNIAELMKSYLYLFSEKFLIDEEIKENITKIFDEDFYEVFTTVDKKGNIKWKDQSLERFVFAYMQIISDGKVPKKSKEQIYKFFKDEFQEKFYKKYECILTGESNKEVDDAIENINIEFSHMLNELVYMLNSYKKYCQLLEDFNDKNKFINYEDYSLAFILTSRFDFLLPLLLTLKLNIRKKIIDENEERKIIDLLDLHNLNLLICNGDNKDSRYLAKYLKKEKYIIRYETLKKFLLNNSGEITESDIYPYDEFVNKLRFTNFYQNQRMKLLGKYILFRIENRIAHEKGSSKEYINFDWTIDHLMSQKNEKWDRDSYDIEYYDEHMHMLCNLTLAKGSLNSSMNNNPWETKMPKLKKSKLEINKKIIELSIQNGWTMFADENSSNIKWYKFIFEEIEKTFDLSLFKETIRSDVKKRMDIIIEDIKKENVKLTATKLLEYAFIRENNINMSCKKVSEVCRDLYKYLKSEFKDNFDEITNSGIDIKKVDDSYMSERLGTFTINSEQKRKSENPLFIKDHENQKWKLIDEIFKKYVS